LSPPRHLVPASVALNTSVLYIGQAIGSFVGGIFYERDWLHAQGFVGAAFVAIALALVIASRPKQGVVS
jgi:predicted MFS family arabinose efflux permease